MKKKIFLSKEDKIMPTVKLAQRLGISVSTASKAKTRGWFYQGFRDAKFKDGKLPPRKKTKFARNNQKSQTLKISKRNSRTNFLQRPAFSFLKSSRLKAVQFKKTST